MERGLPRRLPVPPPILSTWPSSPRTTRPVAGGRLRASWSARWLPRPTPGGPRARPLSAFSRVTKGVSPGSTRIAPSGMRSEAERRACPVSQLTLLQGHLYPGWEYRQDLLVPMAEDPHGCAPAPSCDGERRARAAAWEGHKRNARPWEDPISWLAFGRTAPGRLR